MVELDTKLTFLPTQAGYQVSVNNITVGYISRERGFFTDPTAVASFVVISPQDLRVIADKVDDIQDRLTIQDKLVLKVLSESGMILNAIRNSFIGILTLAQVEASVEKLERLGKVTRVSSGKDPIYTAPQSTSV